MPVIFNPAPFVAAGVTLKLKREREEKRRQQQKNCSTCYNADQDTTDKVACCNCCEDYCFYTRA